MVNEQKGNMYGFITHTWNAIKGSCSHDCYYCYMKRWGKQQKPPRLSEKEFKDDLQSGRFYFVGSSTDMFAKDIPVYWIERTIAHCARFDNEYLFQTKNPQRFMEFIFPPKTTLCTTIESNRHYIGNTPPPLDRAHWIFIAKQTHDVKTMITIEPIMEFDFEEFLGMLLASDVDQINIGADSGGNKLPEPNKIKILQLVQSLRDAGQNVFIKNNLKRINT